MLHDSNVTLLTIRKFIEGIYELARALCRANILTHLVSRYKYTAYVVCLKLSRRREFLENQLGGSRGLRKGISESPLLLSTFLDRFGSSLANVVRT